MPDQPAKKARDRDAQPRGTTSKVPPLLKGEPLPTHKDDLAALAIARGIPSYEAWAMTVPELTEKLEG